MCRWRLRLFMRSSTAYLISLLHRSRYLKQLLRFWLVNPLDPTSTRKYFTSQPASWHSCMRSAYLHFFCCCLVQSIFCRDISILAFFSAVALCKVFFCRDSQFCHYTLIFCSGIHGDIWVFRSYHYHRWKHHRTLIFTPNHLPVLAFLQSIASLSTLRFHIVIFRSFISLEGYSWFLVSFTLIK